MRYELDSAKEADKAAFQTSYHGEKEVQRQGEGFSKQFFIIRNSLVNLTRRDCFVTEDGCSGALSIVTDHLFEVLCGATKLQKSGLGFQDPCNGHQAAAIFSRDRGATKLLELLAEHKSWSNIKELHLRVATNGGTLIKFLGAHKNTLDTLALSHISLTSLGSNSTTWEAALYEIGRTVSLRALALYRL